jgi:hypothetical protein
MLTALPTNYLIGVGGKGVGPGWRRWRACRALPLIDQLVGPAVLVMV